MRKIKELWEKIGVQFIKFGIVGVSNTIVSLVTYYIFTFIGVYYMIANSAGFVTGTLNAYYWNSKFVFKKEAKKSGKKKESLVKTYISYGISFLLSSLLLYIQVNFLGISQTIAPIINVMITTPINYLMNKFWTFAEKG